MQCKNCNSFIEDGAKFCKSCGAAVEKAPRPLTYAPEAKKKITEKDLPEHLRPLSPWAYFGLQILYSIPIVGLVFLIIFSFKKSNINRRNFSLSYFCWMIVVGFAFAGILVLVLISTMSSGAESFTRF